LNYSKELLLAPTIGGYAMMAGMKSTFQVINRMVEDGIIRQYAIGGAVAALNYIEPTLTYDLDILVTLDDQTGRPESGLITLEPIFAYLRKAGYAEIRNEGIVVEGWPVQFLPVANDLDAEGLAQAIEIEIDVGEGSPPIKIKVLRAEHVVATALKVGRPKDRIRVSQFLAEKAVDLAVLRGILDRHDLRQAWSRFCAESGIADLYDVEFNP
jgi:hypothetical protein